MHQRSVKFLVAIPLVLLCIACVSSYSGYGLKPGAATQEDVVRTMGQPAKRWRDPDNSLQLAYPRGLRTYMVFIAPDGKLQRVENVMDPKVFAHLRQGMTEEEVLRALGPPSGETVYFSRRDELAWEWRYCDDWGETARFEVLFDHTKGTVRSTMSMTEAQMGFCPFGRCLCSR